MEGKRSVLDNLRQGEKVKCPDCKNGYYIPYNTTADKAHSFRCSNPECGSFIRTIPMIDID